MSITGALSNALSGLGAASRSAEVVASNIANAMTEGYGRRTVTLSSATANSSGGVTIVGTTRHVDPNLLSERRLAGASLSSGDRLLSFALQAEGLIGVPGDGNSLADRVVELETALVSASNMPDATERLQNVTRSANRLAQGFKDASDGIQAQRMAADQNINAMVEALNSDLSRLAELNSEIVQAQVSGWDTSALLDQQQQIIDRVSELIPVRILSRDKGAVALYSMQGATLLDGSAAQLGFTPSNQITPFQRIDDGTLPGLILNGQPIRTDSTSGVVKGGLLSAEFVVRDELAVEAQANLDALAQDMIERFQTVGVDPTLTAGQAAFFTDTGAVFTGPDNTGLSNRIALNANLAPRQGGNILLVRDGLASVGAGPASSNLILGNLVDAMSADRTLGVATIDGSGSAHDLVTRLISHNGGQRLEREQTASFNAGKFNALKDAELAEGVDSDHEMQQLLLVEQAYTANARVIQTVDALMDALLRI